MNYIQKILELLKMTRYYRFITHSTYFFIIEDSVIIFHLIVALFGYITNKNDWEYLLDSSINFQINYYNSKSDLYHEIIHIYFMIEIIICIIRISF
jgi:hypothetical protein